MKKYKEILLFSGGLDSFIAWHYLGHPPVLFLDAKQSYVKKEFGTVKYFAKKLKMNLIIDNTLDLLKWEKENYYIPYRNVFFAMIASLYAEKVYLVGIKGDSVDDNNSEITKVMSSFLENFNSGQKIEITSPFYNMTKSEIVKWYLDQKLPIDDLKRSRSCYDKNSKTQCGECGSCFRRWIAFENNGIKEKYDKNPWDWKELENYRIRMEKGLYDKSRSKETIQVLKKYGK
ncbi:MAG: 7-cyano-7-deazaguanine synthase [Patescibacteria group bacterium]|jgi:7-cyano-7-deazaguanine synthase in queuosine biosynthesis